MAARGGFPVLEILFLFFTGRGGSFLSQKEKEKNGGRKGNGRAMPAPLRILYALLTRIDKFCTLCYDKTAPRGAGRCDIR